MVIKWLYRGIEAPMGLVLVGALLALCLSSYPIIFFGKSYVSPGYGPAMLYDQLPYVPGYQSTDKEDLSADHGPMPWQNLPYSRVQFEALFEYGEFPLWNRYNSAGLPLFGQGQTQILDPLHWIAVMGEGNGWAWDLKFLLSKLVFLVGIGACVFLMTGSRLATLATIVSAAFVGFFYFRFNHPVYFNLTYAPWIFYSYLQLVRTIESNGRPWLPRWRSLPVIGIFIASLLQLFASTPKEGIILFGALHFAGLIGVAVASRRLRAIVGNVGVLVVLWLSIALVTSPHWLIFLDTLSKSSTAYDAPNCNFANGLWMFVDTLFLGPQDRPWSEPNINTFIFVTGIGALVAVKRWVRRPSFWMVFLPLVGLLAFAYGVVPKSICERIPLVGVIHHIHHTFFTAAVVFAPLLAGFGLASFFSDLRHDRGRLKWTIYIVLVFAVLVWWAYPYYDSYDYATSVAGKIAFISIGGVTLLGFLTVWMYRFRQGYTKRAGACLIGLFAVVHFYHGLHLTTGLGDLDELLINPTPRADMLRSSPAISLLHFDSSTLSRRMVLHPIDALSDRSALADAVLQLARESGGFEQYIVQFEGDLRRAIAESRDAATATAHMNNFLRGVGAKSGAADSVLVAEDMPDEKKRNQLNEELAMIGREPYRVIGEGRAPMSGFYTFLQLESLNGPDALMSDRYMTLLDALGWPRPPDESWLRILKSEEITPLQPMLDLLNVGYFLTFDRNLNVFHLVSNSTGYGQLNSTGPAVSSLANVYLKHHPNMSVDRVSCSASGIQADGKPDKVFSLTLDKLNKSLGISLIHALRLERKHPIGVNHTGGHDYVLGVSNNLGSPLLNDMQGEVRIPVNAGAMRLWLFGCADGFDKSGTEYIARVAIDRYPPIDRIYQNDMSIWARVSPWPRAYFVDSVARYSNIETLAEFIRQAHGIPLAAIEDKEVSEPDNDRTVVAATDYELTANSTSFRIMSPGPGIVVLTEVNIPGDVHVEVNREPGKVITVNHAFRGVEIPEAGNYEITFTYRPELWNFALALTGCGLLILVMMVIVFSRNKRLPPALAT